MGKWNHEVPLRSRPGNLLAVAGAALAAGVLAGSALGGTLHRRSSFFHGRTVVITGGSRGLGLVLARQLAREGARIALLARDFEELAAARDQVAQAGGEVFAVPCDVTVRGDVENAIHNVLRRFGRLDVLINNAGLIQVGPLENMTIEDYEAAMAVHFWAPLYTMTAALPALRQAGDARIVNVTSFAGRFAVPHLAPYTASKFALVGLTEVWGAELAQRGIAVTTVVPGPLRTGSHVNAFFKGQPEKEYAWFADSMGVPGISTAAENAARQILEGCVDGEPEVVVGLSAQVLIALQSLAPRITRRAVRTVARTMPAPGSSQARTGWMSRSALSPRVATWPGDRNIKPNLEHLAPQAPGQG